MNDNEFRENLKKRDAETLEDRIARRNELSPIEYRGGLPQLIWDYSGQAIDMYISGHFVGVLFLSATMVELALADALVRNFKATQEVVECLTLDEKTRLCRKFGIINGDDKRSIDTLRQIRNALTHANAGKLTEIAKSFYSSVDDVILQVLPSLYLGNFGGSMKSQALKFLEFTRRLTWRWYGVNQTDSPSGQA